MKKMLLVLMLILSMALAGCVWCDHEIVDVHTIDKNDVKLIGMGYTKRENDCCYVAIDSTFYMVNTIYLVRGNEVGFITVKPVEDLFVTVVDFQISGVFGDRGVKCLLGIWDEAKIDSVFIRH